MSNNIGRSPSHRRRATLTGLSVLAAGAAVLASAGAAGAAGTNDPQAAAARRALGGAACGDARLCAFVAQNGSVVRSKNVTAVTNPETGVTCIKPKAGLLQLGKIVPSVTVEWGLSSGSDLLAFYRASAGSCPTGTIEVRTYDLQENLSSRVAFTLVVD